MKLYYKYPHERENVLEFERFMKNNPKVLFFQPNPISAPWHVQAIVNDLFLNFWPHKMKGQIENRKARSGRKALQAMVDFAYSDGMNKDFHVID